MLVFRTTPDVSWALLVKDLTDRIGAVYRLFIACAAFPRRRGRASG